MKNLLVISSATKKAYLGLKTQDNVTVAEIDANCKQSENILVEIDKLLNGSNLEIGDIDVIGVVVGPGSFTGVRIGVALVKGFCAVNKNIKVCPISSLDLIAEHINTTKPFVCGINALSGLVFAKQFAPQSEEKLVTLEEFDALEMERYGLQEETICQNKISIDPHTLLALLEKEIARENFVEPNELCPVYLRNSQAEENLKKNLKN